VLSDHLQKGQVVPATLHAAIRTVLAASVAVGLLVALAASIESRRSSQEASIGRMRRGVGAIANRHGSWPCWWGGGAAGDPVARVQHAWGHVQESHKGMPPMPRATASSVGWGASAMTSTGLRWTNFALIPLIGIGADNFAEQYLAHGRSEVDPPLSAQRRAAHTDRDGSGRRAAGNSWAGGPHWWPLCAPSGVPIRLRVLWWRRRSRGLRPFLFPTVGSARGPLPAQGRVRH